MCTTSAAIVPKIATMTTLSQYTQGIYRRITKDDYDKKLQELKDKQYRLNIEAEEHTKADHDYKLTISHVFSMSRRMGAIFESSEVPEKRAILNFLLQNPKVSDKKLVFTMAKPFDAVLELANCPTLLRDQDSNLEPTPYTLPFIAKGVDYIIIPITLIVGCEALRAASVAELLLFRIVSTPFSLPIFFYDVVRKTWLGIAR